MKNQYLRSAVVVVVLASLFGLAYYLTLEETPPAAEGNVVWRSFDDGMALAGQTNKKLLVDVYTDWCSWCKKMDAEVYADKDVSGLVNDRFVAVKLNAESDKPVNYKGKKYKESELAHELGVTGYPTTVFFDEHSTPITAVPGYSPATEFSGLLRFIGQDYYKSVTYQEYLSQSAAGH